MVDQREAKENLRSEFPVDTKPYTGNYDYDADSDLEEDEDWDPSDVEDSQVILPGKERSDKADSATLVDSKGLDTKGDEPSDIISVSDVDSLSLDSVDTKAEAGVPVTPTPAHIGTVVVIDDVAFVT